MSASNLSSCGNEGRQGCQRQPSASQFQSKKCGGEWVAPFTPPSGRPCLYLLLGSWKQSEALTVCIQHWPEPCLRGGMQSGDACLPGRKCWNLIITSSLSWEINEETEKEKKSIPATPHEPIPDVCINTLLKCLRSQRFIYIYSVLNPTWMDSCFDWQLWKKKLPNGNLGFLKDGCTSS